jgi:hypothetical protein
LLKLLSENKTFAWLNRSVPNSSMFSYER